MGFAWKTEVAEDGKSVIGQQMLEYLRRINEPSTGGESEDAYGARICAKARAGKKLTPEEMNYLARNYPELYAKVLRAQSMRRALESKLNGCKSKQEAQEAFSMVVNSISDLDPDKEMMIGALEEAFKEFRKSDEYNRMPEKTEEESGQTQALNLEYRINGEGYQETYTKSVDKGYFSLKG